MWLHVSLNPADLGDLSTIKSCASDMSWWFVKNALLANPTKTEAVIFVTIQRLSQINRSQGELSQELMGSSLTHVKLLGVTLDSTVTFDKYVIDVNCSVALVTTTSVHCAIYSHCSRSYMALATIGSRLDYCNSVLYRMSQANINRLQRVQNILVPVVARAPRTVSSLDIRRDFHWLPLSYSVTYKLCLITWKTFNTVYPPSQSKLITHYLPPRGLTFFQHKSSGQNFLH